MPIEPNAEAVPRLPDKTKWIFFGPYSAVLLENLDLNQTCFYKDDLPSGHTRAFAVH